MHKREKHTKSQMYTLIRKWESSGLSQEKFFHQHGIAKSTFGYWRKKYLRENGRSKQKGNFIPVKFQTPVKTETELSGQIEIIYPNGVRMVCPAGMDLSRLHPILR